MAEAARDAFVETLPASPTFVAVRIGVIALLIPIFWLWLGTVAAVAIAVVLAPLLALFAPRALVLDDEGFRMLSLVPRRKVLWRTAAPGSRPARLRRKAAALALVGGRA